MRFKAFFYSEEVSSTDKGLMGYAVASSVDVPSKGPGQKHPNLGSVAGQTPRPGGSGSPTPPQFMKKMRKWMKK